MHNLICQLCGTAFQHKRKDRKTCSKACRQKQREADMEKLLADKYEYKRRIVIIRYNSEVKALTRNGPLLEVDWLDKPAKIRKNRTRNRKG